MGCRVSLGRDLLQLLDRCPDKDIDLRVEALRSAHHTTLVALIDDFARKLLEAAAQLLLFNNFRRVAVLE